VKFGVMSVAEALGGIVAHALRQGDFVLKKGTKIDAAMQKRLVDHGIGHVTVAMVEAGDVTEDEAASRLATAVMGQHVRLDLPFTGRTNLFAEAAGVLMVDEARVDAVNMVDNAITLATLPALRRVAEGEMIGTVKIIPFAVEGQKLEAAMEAARDALSVAPFQTKRLAVISTELPGLKRSVIDKTLRVLEERLENAGTTDAKIISHVIIPHEQSALTAALGELKIASPDIIIIYGASAIADRRDVIPFAIEQAGGVIDHFGMPVDPGNLLLIAHLGQAKVIGAPGCARSPKENGFDWVLERFLANVPVTKSDIRKMGVGGLLMEIISRPQPRALDAVPSTPQVAVLVLAAGSSTRMGTNKLTEIWNGKPILRHSVEAALSSQRAGPFLMITGYEAKRSEACIAGLDVAVQHNPDFASGLASSLKVGIAALPETADGVIVMLGDMPKITGAMLDRLILAFGENRDAKAVVPLVTGQRGNPVLLSRSAFGDVQALSGDQGARKLLDLWGEAVIDVALDDDALLFDVDTPDALQKLRLM
jgi:molybdenum cofactor cytidylyltransferase